MQKIYEVWQNLDATEGRGPVVKIGSWVDRDIAELIVKGLPHDMGGGPLSEIREAWLYGATDDHVTIQRLRLLEAIRRRLGAVEWQALRDGWKDMEQHLKP